MHHIATAINATLAQINAAITLLDEGATVPFIARYRKEATGGLNDEQLRDLVRLLSIHRNLETRRTTILKTLTQNKQLTKELEKAIHQAGTRAELDTLFEPYKSTRKTKADLAREKGIEPLAEAILAGQDLQTALKRTPSLAKEDKESIEEGIQEILIDKLAKNTATITRLSKDLATSPIHIKAARGKKEEAEKWLQNTKPESAKTMPGHRAMGLFRAMKEGILSLDPEPEIAPIHTLTKSLSNAPNPLIRQSAQAAWKGRVGTVVKNAVLAELRERAEQEAVTVFRKNLKDLLLAAPAGPKKILGLDPGLRTGIKAALIDETGKVLVTKTLYPMRDALEAKKGLQAMAHHAALIAIGNGTGGREASAWVEQIIGKNGPRQVIVSEAGASVYSASELASKELPTLDVSLRGAVSIARRLQDPLAELVKIDPKSLGIGQYQHDVQNTLLEETLSAVVQDAVSAVGVDANTASPSLLSHIPGIGPSLAEKIVEHRNKKGPFKTRKDLKKVAGLGPKAFEQAAGFLRIFGDNPLDATSIHPESYDIVETIAKHLNVVVADVLQHPKLTTLSSKTFASFGAQTVSDILVELQKPGRDPRPQFRTAALEHAITTIEDLKPGMRLEGTVTNVAAFGAFVDLGVHQDGLIHISEMRDSFVSDPSEVVKVGDIVRVRIIDIDVNKKRISLSLKHETRNTEQPHTPPQKTEPKGTAKQHTENTKNQDNSPFASLSALASKTSKK